MIFGAHFILYSKDPDADRAFLRDVLEFQSVDAGRGWLIFALPPSELAVHPGGADSPQAEPGHAMFGAEFYLMCDNLQESMKALGAKGVQFSPVDEARWGSKTTLRLPSGGEIGLYQPKHQTALGLKTGG